MTTAIEPYLDKYGLTFNPNRSGNQPICCPNPSHDDKTPSASLNLGKQLWNCLACGAGGSVVDLIMTVEGKSLRDALSESEGGVADGGREVPRQPQRSSLGLPGRSRVQRRDGGQPPAWAGFR